MYHDLVIKGGSCFVTDKDGYSTWTKVDIGIQKNEIAELGNGLSGKQTLDAKGLKVLPGLIDSQVHFRDPGLTHKEDLLTGTRSAVMGGITAVFEMPNTKPNTATRERLDEKLALAAKKAHCDYAFFAGATGANSDQLPTLEKHPGCSGVKIFMGSSTGDLLVAEDEKLEKVLASGTRRVAIHCEDEARLKIRKEIAIKEAHPRAHPIWRDIESALTATKRIVALAKKTGRPIHTLHITTEEELSFLAQNKQYASVECLPQHLVLDSPECYERLGSLAQMNPPIREKRHQEALWKALNSGIIDVMGSDHAPHTLEEKQKTYPNCPSGLPGVQTTVPLMLEQISQGKTSLEKLIELMAVNPCKLFGVQKRGHIKPGYRANFTILDMNKEKTIENKWIQTKCGYTPFDGMKVHGWPVATVVGGKIAMREEQLMASPGSGEKILFN